MLSRVASAVIRTVRGVITGIRVRPGVFVAITLGVFVVSVSLPVVVLSLARRPWDFFMFNPWLSKLPEYLASTEVPLRQKLEFLPNLDLFWFLADGPYGSVEWGYALDVRGLARMGFTSILIGSYFALWFSRRDFFGQRGWGASASQHAGVAGALAGTLGLSTGPCSVLGCGASVMPVVGLIFTGLSGGTMKWLLEVSRLGAAVVLFGMTLGVAYFSWLVGTHAGGSRGMSNVKGTIEGQERE